MPPADADAAQSPPPRRPASADFALGSHQAELWASDEWRMKHAKVQPCHKRYAHDWATCPCAHPREGARRRDPTLHHYTGIACPAMKQEGRCGLGDACPYAHNVFEYWLHPTRYRTQLCNDGGECRRWLCFFAHSLGELRVPENRPWVPSPGEMGAAGVAAAAAGAAGAVPDSGGRALRQQPRRHSLQLPPHQMRLSHQQQQQRGPVAPRSAPASRGPSIDMALPTAADAAAHQALTAALQQHQQQQQQQQHPQQGPGRSPLLELVVQLMQQGELPPDKAAHILRCVLPPQQAAAHLDHAQPAHPTACLWETGCYSTPMAQQELGWLSRQPRAPPAGAPHRRSSADGYSAFCWPGGPAPQHAAPPAQPPSMQQPRPGPSLPQPETLPPGSAASRQLASTADRLLLAGGMQAQHSAALPLLHFCHSAGSPLSTFDAPSSVSGAAGLGSGATSPSRGSLEGGEADPAGRASADPILAQLPGLLRLQLASSGPAQAAAAWSGW